MQNYVEEERLKELYLVSGWSQTKIAKELNVSQTTIKKYLLKYNIDFTYKKKLPYEKFILNEIIQSVLNGAMLGDGSLIRGKFCNAAFRYKTAIYEHTEFISSFFSEFLTERYNIPKKYEYLDKRTDKIYTSYEIRTKNNICFSEQFNRWYINEKKDIPNDLVLDSISCLIWYIGDGGLINNSTQTIKLSTNSFSPEKIEKIIIPQLSEFYAKMLFNEKKQPIVIIPRTGIKGFLEYIGKYPIKCMDYKWNIVEKKNNYTKNIHSHNKDNFIKSFMNGDKSYYRVAQEFKVNPGVVRYYLKKEGIL